MKLSAIALGILPLAVLAVPSGSGPGSNADAAAWRRIDQLQTQYQQNIRNAIKGRQTGCTPSKLLRRREWGSLSKRDRQDYIDAAYCLARKPNKIPLSEMPGARRRYDDFVASHLQQTPFVHADGLFLGYHRHYVHLYERALREECGYKGTQPYWDWTLSYTDPSKMTVFDGSPWSLGSNGVFVPGRNATELPLPGTDIVLVFPPATGGGCIQTGPFTEDKFKAILGPVGNLPQGPDGGQGYNPRCLVRDLSPTFSRDAGPQNVTALLDGSPDLGTFNTKLDIQGVHGVGHFLVGGEQLDVFVSPNDPIFWLHHAQVDRVWAIWQGQNLAERVNAVWGTQTSGNFPPSDNVTLTTQVNFGIIGPSKPLKEVVSTVDYDHCYIYE
ncbi:hypothetical protein OQA88_13455 [Cercophora sp. LCS_1]